jgi:sugar/nucleoside kinase (ribokinase family)
MDLLAIGGITFDHLFWVDRLPEKHFEGIIKRQGRFYGGRAPNVAVAASKLGIRTGLVSSVGEDFSSEGYEGYLRAIGVDLRGVVKVPREKTKQIFIFTDPQGAQITFFDYGAEFYFRKMDVPCDLIKESKIVHISSSGDYKFNIRCARFAYKNNVSVSFDPGNDPFTEISQYLRKMIKYCEFLFVNNLEAINIVNRLGLKEINDLRELGPKVVVIINKEDKSGVIYTEEEKQVIPSMLKSVKDPTGCSDGFVAAFLVGYLKGFSLDVAGMLGAIEASFIAEDYGSQTNLPNWDVLFKKYYTLIGRGEASLR